ncbi:putative ferric-chelate reductase 1 [Acanthochromis polyacanthus]|uniref:putative ferric-chelate reductase 1 n=1 Tax=Acanthochromis polyacanthus TaxID=80966 RepID=UPI0022343FC8|nr:putative ferric-chelate reductase 1 [Acanthochromis polyacanthus]
MDLVLLLLLVFVPPAVQCYSSGVVLDSCEDMKPRHSGLSPQTGLSPFTVTTEHSSYRPGEEVTVQLQAPASTPFTGFLLQAREVGGRSPVGSYAVAAGPVQLLTCGQTPNNSADISAVVFTGVSETYSASFVQNYNTFWVGVRSPTLTLTNDSNGSLSPATTSTSNTTPALSISSADCGVSKVCFSQPSDCDPAISAGCYFLSATMLSTSGAAVHYEMSGSSNGYISFGFSDDQMMGDDDIYICGISSDGLVSVQHAFSTGRTAPQALPLGNVTDVQASVQDNVIRCSFTSMNTISTQRTSGFNKTYHLMFAYGPSNNGRIQFHTGTFTSTDKVDISRPGLVQKAGRPHIIKAHGALMLIAWMSTGSLGMMAARYLRVGIDQKLCGKDVWFVVHVVLMGVTVAATITAFILSFSYVKAWSGGVHPVLGCIVLILSVLQPILALLRCGPQHPLRIFFNWTHALNGLATKVLSVAAIFTGLKLIDSTINQWLMKVMGALVGWEVLFYILLEAHLKWKVKSKDATTTLLESNTVTVAVLLMALFFFGNLSVLVALLVGIGMS